MDFKVKRADFEDYLQKEDVAQFFLEKSSAEIEEKYGSLVARMVNYNQENVHHCYDLWEHTLRTVEVIKPNGLTKDQFVKLRVAAFFHDIGKPDKAFVKKDGQKAFYGHAQQSAIVAKPILEDLEYNEKEIEQLLFFIGHHDDFISYSDNLPPYMQNHIFMREISPESVAEKILENKYDFDKMGYSKTEIRYICYKLARGKTPNFYENRQLVKVSVDMDEVERKMKSGEFNSQFTPTLEDYKLLLTLCKADAGAQAVESELNGRKVGSRKEKIDRMINVDNNLEKAFLIVQSIENKRPTLAQIGKIARNADVQKRED